MLVEAVCEPGFLGSSYGFRPGRSAHQALEVLWKRLMDMAGAVVIDLGIQSYFDTLDPGQLRPSPHQSSTSTRGHTALTGPMASTTTGYGARRRRSC
jgi:hypothetical protein